MKKENKLPAKNNKIKRAIWMLLASIGIASSIPNSTIASSNQNINMEKDVEEKSKNDFFNNLRVNLPMEHIDNYKNMALEVVKEKQYNLDNDKERGNEIALQHVIKLFDQIDKNTPRYASLHGIKDTRSYTNDYKKATYECMKTWLRDLVYVQGKYNKQDPYWDMIGSANSGITYHNLNLIIINPKKEQNCGILAHEMAHAMQWHLGDINLYLPNYKIICQRIGEGMAADYGKKVENIDDYGTEYPTDYYIYKIANFLSRGKVEQWKRGKIKGDLYKLLSSSLDSKYGDGTGAKLYTFLANVCKYSRQYGKCESLEENNEKQSYIKTKIEKIKNDDKISKEDKDKQISELNIYMECNKNYCKSLVENGSKRINNGKKVANEELRELNEFALDLIERDINEISTLKDAEQALINWNLYKATCMISKDNKRGCEVSTKDYIHKAKQVQNLLFEKCKETKLLNEKVDKGIFTSVLDSNINDISNVTIVKQKNKLVVMDQYAINTLREEPNNSLLGVIEDKDKNIDENSKKNKIKNKEKNYTLESVGNYAKEFAQEIKGEYIDFIDKERLQER